MFKFFRGKCPHPDAPVLPAEKCWILMAEIVDDYTPLHLQSVRYEVDFDPAKVSPDGRHYNFGQGEGRATGWQSLSRKFGERGFYFVERLAEKSAA